MVSKHTKTRKEKAEDAVSDLYESAFAPSLDLLLLGVVAVLEGEANGEDSAVAEYEGVPGKKEAWSAYARQRAKKLRKIAKTLQAAASCEITCPIYTKTK